MRNSARIDDTDDAKPKRKLNPNFAKNKANDFVDIIVSSPKNARQKDLNDVDDHQYDSRADP